MKNEIIKLVDWPDMLYKRQHMYFASGEANEAEIIESVVETAKVLGSKNVFVLQESGWSYICSDYDWFSTETKCENDIDTVFGRLLAFPEMGANCFRGEVLCAPFSVAVCTFCGDHFISIKGDAMRDSAFLLGREKLKNWRRVVAFKYSYKSE